MISFTVQIVRFTCVFIGIVSAVPSTKLPKGFVQCKLSDPGLNDCIKDGLQSAYPLLSKGIPSLGLLPLDPIRITSLVVDQGVGAVKLKLKFRDLDILNMHSSVIDELIYDPHNYTFTIDLSLRKPIILEGLYEVNGKVLIVPITGNGTCKITLDDYKSFSVIKMKPIVKNGDTHLKIETLLWRFTTSKLHMQLNNLFNGDKVLGDHMNAFLNENWEELLNDMQPTFENALSSAFVSIGQRFFNRISLNQIFID